jgi:hypothetical protein
MAAGVGNLQQVTDALHSEAFTLLDGINTTIQMGCLLFYQRYQISDV